MRKIKGILSLLLSLILALGLFIFPTLSEGEHACPNCGHRFPEDSIPKFCTSCGTSIQACRVCGFLFEAGNIPAFCTNCGASQVYAGDNNPAAGDEDASEAADEQTSPPDPGADSTPVPSDESDNGKQDDSAFGDDNNWEGWDTNGEAEPVRQGNWLTSIVAVGHGLYCGVEWVGATTTKILVDEYNNEICRFAEDERLYTDFIGDYALVIGASDNGYCYRVINVEGNIVFDVAAGGYDRVVDYDCMDAGFIIVSRAANDPEQTEYYAVDLTSGSAFLLDQEFVPTISPSRPSDFSKGKSVEWTYCEDGFYLGVIDGDGVFSGHTLVCYQLKDNEISLHCDNIKDTRGGGFDAVAKTYCCLGERNDPDTKERKIDRYVFDLQAGTVQCEPLLPYDSYNVGYIESCLNQTLIKVPNGWTYVVRLWCNDTATEKYCIVDARTGAVAQLEEGDDIVVLCQRYDGSYLFRMDLDDENVVCAVDPAGNLLFDPMPYKQLGDCNERGFVTFDKAERLYTLYNWNGERLLTWFGHYMFGDHTMIYRDDSAGTDASGLELYHYSIVELDRGETRQIDFLFTENDELKKYKDGRYLLERYPCEIYSYTYYSIAENAAMHRIEAGE